MILYVGFNYGFYGKTKTNIILRHFILGVKINQKQDKIMGNIKGRGVFLILWTNIGIWGV
jgi:hypothetical protein